MVFLSNHKLLYCKENVSVQDIPFKLNSVLLKLILKQNTYQSLWFFSYATEILHLRLFFKLFLNGMQKPILFIV